MDWDNFRAERKLYGRPFVVAHRGAPTLEPENTLRSFFTALVQGADALETDLRFTADDELVLFHDPTLERMTEGSGPLRDQSLAALPTVILFLVFQRYLVGGLTTGAVKG